MTLPTTTLHFMCGKAGAGKSTLAKQLAAEHNAVLIAEDVCLVRLYPTEMQTFEDYRTYSRRLRSIVGPLAVQILASQSVVLDFPANTVETRVWFKDIFDAARCQHVLHFMDVPDAVCLERIAKRNVEKPEGSHHLTEEMFHYISSFFQAPARDEGFNVRRYWEGGGLQ